MKKTKFSTVEVEAVSAYHNHPTFYTKKEVNHYVDMLPDENFKYGNTTDNTILGKIAVRCISIAHTDTNFQNLNSEIEKAEKCAKDIQIFYDEIIELIKLVPAHSAITALTILQIPNLYYMRVLGDAMQRLDKLEDKVKNLHRNESLHIKSRRYALKEDLYKSLAKSPRKDIDFNY